MNARKGLLRLGAAALWWVLLMGAGQDAAPMFGPYLSYNRCVAQAQWTNNGTAYTRTPGTYYTCRWVNLP